jgi:hypothetical protein
VKPQNALRIANQQLLNPLETPLPVSYIQKRLLQYYSEKNEQNDNIIFEVKIWIRNTTYPVSLLEFRSKSIELNRTTNTILLKKPYQDEVETTRTVYKSKLKKTESQKTKTPVCALPKKDIHINITKQKVRDTIYIAYELSLECLILVISFAIGLLLYHTIAC